MKPTLHFALPLLAAVSCLGQSEPPYGYFETNLVPVADAAIENGAPNSNFGSGTNLYVGVANSGALYRSLIRFDLSWIPANSRVTNVALTIIGDGPEPGQSASRIYYFSPLLKSWIESQATWNDRAASTPWSAPGGQNGTDFMLDPAAFLNWPATANTTNTVLGPGTNFGIGADVQNWISHPSQNFGWIVTAEDEVDAGNLLQFASRENPRHTEVLTFDYDPPIAQPVLEVDPETNGDFNFSFITDPRSGYVIQTCSQLPQWHDILVLDPAGPGFAPSESTFSFPTNSGDQFFRVIVKP